VARSDPFKWQSQEPSLGSHLVTPRRGYLHHGIYVGDGKVVHYSGFSDGLHGGPVEEVDLDSFAHGRPVWIQSDAPPNFEPREVVRRARSRVGEDRYRVLTNNCEHFCEWCLRGEHRSYQVEALLARPRRVLHATIRLVARPVSALGQVDVRPTGTTAASNA
jgi:hypothetical protein